MIPFRVSNFPVVVAYQVGLADALVSGAVSQSDLFGRCDVPSRSGQKGVLVHELAEHTSALDVLIRDRKELKLEV